MQIVSDAAMDLSPQQRAGLDIHLIPLTFTLEGKSYRSGIDIQPDEFYKLLASTDQFPTTSQPAPGDFADLYRKVIAGGDRDILSIHVSSGLSGTINAAKIGAGEVPEANVTFVDTKTLSGAQGWQVEAAARAVKAGWSIEQIHTLLTQIGKATDTLYTLATLRYLIHGGRISHMKGLAASVLNIKPIIGVDKESGKYAQRGQLRTLNKAIVGLADIVAQQHRTGTPLQVQILHANNEEGSALLKEKMDSMFPVKWLPTHPIAPVLGAHTGAGLVGFAYAAQADLPQIPA